MKFFKGFKNFAELNVHQIYFATLNLISQKKYIKIDLFKFFK